MTAPRNRRHILVPGRRTVEEYKPYGQRIKAQKPASRAARSSAPCVCGLTHPPRAVRPQNPMVGFEFDANPPRSTAAQGVDAGRRPHGQRLRHAAEARGEAGLRERIANLQGPRAAEGHRARAANGRTTTGWSRAVKSSLGPSATLRFGRATRQLRRPPGGPGGGSACSMLPPTDLVPRRHQVRTKSAAGSSAGVAARAHQPQSRSR